jgi:cellobiose phosphorylase
MAAVEERLVRPEGKLIQLFDPPFDRGSLQPGYIKGYVPGIPEKGGQYTHAATWVVPGRGPAGPAGAGTVASRIYLFSAADRV